MVDRMSKLVRNDDRSTLSLQGARLTRICFGEAIELEIDSEEDGRVSVMLVNSFRLGDKSGGDEIRFDASTPKFDSLLSLRGDTVEGFDVCSDGLLQVTFGSGKILTIETASCYEAWEIDAEKFILVGLPGGGASVTHDD
jgi:hypothetical protein